jgi:hypothetical protein
MDGPVGVDDMERPKTLFLVQPRQELVCLLDWDGTKTVAHIQLQNPRHHELAQTAVRVVEEPGFVSRAAA